MSKLIPVKSSNINAIRFDQGVLEVHFQSGVYQYTGIPDDVYTEFLEAQSLGGFLAKQIKPNFPCWRHHEPDANVMEALRGMIEHFEAPEKIAEAFAEAVNTPDSPLGKFRLSTADVLENGAVAVTLVESESRVLDVTYLPQRLVEGKEKPAEIEGSFWIRIA